MNTLLYQLAIGLRLHFRNRMALLYGYLFPLVFLLAFWVLYRHERVPLVRHMGELLTVTVLGGACFGMPTTMVGERERGVWRRYRLAPVSSARLVLGTLTTRYAILITAGLLQLAVAMTLGMPSPRHPFDLWLAFTFVAFAFIGLGLVIAMMADNVPAVQALGQCIFLPMLIIGGVAVPLAALPPWAQHVSAFFPGRYAVEALQACVNGSGLGSARFSLLALLLIGAAGVLAGAKLFRWDAQQRFAAREGKAWVAVALAAWAAVGLFAEARGRVLTPRDSGVATMLEGAGPRPSGVDSPTSIERPVAAPLRAERTPAERGEVSGAPASSRKSPASSNPERRSTRVSDSPPAAASETAAPPPSPPRSGPASWQAVTMEDIERDLVFERLPPDAGVVTPIAPLDQEPDAETAEHVEFIRAALPAWGPGQVKDPVQRVRNYLFLVAVPDVFQLSIERYLPNVVFERIQEDVPHDQLIKVLYWIALHPFEGDDKAVDELHVLQLGNGPSDMDEARQRAAIYGVKLLGRITGKIKPER